MIAIPVVRGRKNPLYFGLARRLAAAREAAGIARQPLSQLAGVGKATVQRLEAESSIPSVETLERIADALQLSPCWLAFGEEQPFTATAELRCAAIGARLRQAREALGLSRHALGKAAGTTGTTVQTIEDGLSMPGLDIVEQLAKALRVTPCWLAYGAEAVARPGAPR